MWSGRTKLAIVFVVLVVIGASTGAVLFKKPLPVRHFGSTTTSSLPQRGSLDPARSRPVHLTISALQLSTPIGLLGLNNNGSVMVPKSAQEVGWFRLGPTPGQLGASVLLGHVDSSYGIGVFFGLQRLTKGSAINVQLANGDDLTFTVTRVAQFAKSNFPAKLVYTSPNKRSLNLVTCGGVFNRAKGSYESNVVVFSELTRRVPPAVPSHSS